MLKDVRQLAETAGQEIMTIYRSGSWTVSEKSDSSPVTQADLAANAVIVPGLEKISDAPVISEEGLIPPDAVGSRFWLVDPLDGTRDFVAKLDTFVVCIALIENQKPIFGLIHAPVTGLTWWAEKGKGAFGPDDRKIWNDGRRGTALIAAGSRSMPSDRMKAFLQAYGIQDVHRFGSALKFCKLAEGDFDLYPRFGPTHEWDTAAGQIIAEEAGCKVIDLTTNKPLAYGKPGFLNRGFCASRSDLDIVGQLEAKGLRPPPKP